MTEGSRQFYDDLWEKKCGDRRGEGRRSRDRFHRWFLDRIIDPSANSRHEVAGRMLPSGERLLDIGCWNGDSLIAMGAPKKFAKVYGIDISPAAAEEARKKGIEASVVDIDREPLPFADGFFDCVTLLGVLEHLFDPYAVLPKIRRVLKPGGVLIVDVPNVASFSNRVRILIGRVPVTSLDPGWDGGHLHYFTPRDLKRFLDGRGFAVVGRGASGGGQWIKRLLFPMVGEFLFRCVKREDVARISG